MYTEYYKLQEKPFSIVPDPSFLYPSSKHRTALTYLEYGLMDRMAFILLTGEIGAGKTILIKQLLTKIESDIEVAVIFNTNVSSEDLLELILCEFELEPSIRSKAGYLDTLNQFLIREYGEGKRVVLIVDEAQNLSQEALEELRMLSNLYAGKDSLIQIVLAGQPSLGVRLRHPSLAQLYQRIAVSYHIASLGLDETREYIVHRLKKAGAEQENLFTDEAVERIFQVSGGIPRTINILCDAALVYGYADELKTIDADVIEHVLTDKKETGVLSVSSIDEIQSNPAASLDNGSMAIRLQSIEERLNKLSFQVDWQIENYEKKIESYKDALIHKLERMLDEERKQNKGLLLKYNLLLYSMNKAKGKNL
ncbi:MAG: XrtA-associated ATPase [Proteobacteria bacterium]|nr:XrtA-associated ATPase [Pseudomonadota bacterium]MBU4259492.1 XrtA-associated ATPase [Pseudomonadota bacterium]MBU4286760.1 XrtA-associated ATPase [Pseudomonadota bacterium]MBU4415501.1 XrtA-associated ATPase [Pseudomonadota bacterium]MCG2758192.1 XrtA-associated ATPase [Desulfobacteraceae bacterium]